EIFRDDDVGNWLSSQNQNELEINDLGYYIGYEVCERYYHKSTDKKQAIKELIELDYNSDIEFAKILDGSGFLPMTWNEIGVKYESMRPTVIRISEFKNGSKNVSTNSKTITIEFSETMSSCCRNFDFDASKTGAFLKIKKIIGWSEDKRKFSFEIEELKPNTDYHIIISNFAKEDGGNRLAPYTIEFRTNRR
ncbi:MAG: Ig-like domain-containing protein, partial [Chitinophagaceae bacterium]|nr:Ig-like domain-containing protein [Chitinophagaceae bacterium]